jgi:hypothetical protein
MPKKQNFENCQKKLEDLVSVYIKDEDKDMYKKTYELFQIVSNFIIKKNLMLYGGYAINSLLPPKDRFYDEYALIDFDCFSDTAKKDAEELTDILSKKGFKYIEMKPAIHDGTFKIFVEFIPIFDVTQMPTKLLKTLKNMRKTETSSIQQSTRYIITPTTWLIKEMLLELSSPKSSLFRWTKIFERYILFKKYYTLPNPGIRPKQINIEANEALAPILKSSLSYFKKYKTPLVGNIGYMLHETQSPSFNVYENDNAIFHILHDCGNDKQEQVEIKKLATSIEKHLSTRHKKQNIHIEGNILYMKLDSDEIPHPHHQSSPSPESITSKQQIIPLIYIYNIHSKCFAIETIKGYTVGTLFNILYHYTSDYINNFGEKVDNILKHVQNVEKLIKQKKCNVSALFKNTCVGTPTTIFQIKKERWNKKIKSIRPPQNSRKNKSILI